MSEETPEYGMRSGEVSKEESDALMKARAVTRATKEKADATEKETMSKKLDNTMERIRADTAFKTDLKVKNEMFCLSILTDLGIRKDKGWGPDEDELLEKLLKLAHKQTGFIMKSMDEYKLDYNKTLGEAKDEKDIQDLHDNHAYFQGDNWVVLKRIFKYLK